MGFKNMSDYQYLTTEIDARGVAFVGLNRPDIHNAFDAVLIGELTHIFTALKADDSVRLVVLFGHGKSFCAGADLNWMRAMKDYSREENIADSTKLADMFDVIRNLPKPVIGVVQGAALGGGAGLVAVCDYVLASAGAKFGFTEARLGILPAVISPYVIEKIGVSHARAYFTSGMRFDETVAQQMALIHQVAADDNLEQARDKLVAAFLKAAPQTGGKAKTLIDQVVQYQTDASATQKITVELIADLRISDEGQEGMAALLEKRKASWVA
jgi:methylglutaconyl-CoA hydratase